MKIEVPTLFNHSHVLQHSAHSPSVVEFLNGNTLVGVGYPLWKLTTTPTSRSYEWCSSHIRLYRTEKGYLISNASVNVEFSDASDLFSLVWDGSKFTESPNEDLWNPKHFILDFAGAFTGDSRYKLGNDIATLGLSISQAISSWKGNSNKPPTQPRPVYNSVAGGYISLANGDSKVNFDGACVARHITRDDLGNAGMPRGAACLAVERSQDTGQDIDRRWNLVYGRDFAAVQGLTCVSPNIITHCEFSC